MSTTRAPQVHSNFDPITSTITHVVHDGPGTACAIVDPVLDYEAKSGRTHTRAADQVIAFVREQGLRVEWILETHAHADHLTAAPYLKAQLGGRIAIGAHITEVQKVFSGVFHLGPTFATDGSQFDALLDDGQSIDIGELKAEVIHLPGHTPACVAYRVGNAVFVGDTIFMPDVGTARADFPGGDAQTLYRSVRRLLSLPPETRLYLCHDYPPAERALATSTTVAEQRSANIHVRDQIDEAAFVRMRQTRDATLDMPVLIIPAVQVNIRAGHMPAPQANGVSYLKIPVNGL